MKKQKKTLLKLGFMKSNVCSMYCWHVNVNSNYY